MDFFRKVVKNDVDVACNKKAFRNFKAVFLFKKVNVITVFGKFVTQVTQS